MRMRRLLFGSLICLALAACTGPAGQSPVPAADTPVRTEIPPSSVPTATQTARTATSIQSPTPFSESERTPLPTHARPPDTLTPTSQPSPTPEPVQETETPTPTLNLPPTALPTINPADLDEELQSNLEACPFECDNGKAYRITGWAYGFRPSGYCAEGPFRWMDQNHLLLFPLTGEDEVDWVEWTRPVVVTLKTEKFWLPPVSAPAPGCDLPVWSPAVHRLVTYDGERVLVLKADGSVAVSFSGSHPLDLSPSGKRVMAGDTWIDLESGQTVEFTQWDGTISKVYPPAWTSDESRVYTCCFSYGDANTGTGKRFDLSGVQPVGRGLEPGFAGIPSDWVMGDSFALTQWDFFYGLNFGILPLIDPVGQTYQDLRALTGIRSDSYCSVQSLSPDKKHAWLACQSDAFWLDLASFRTLAFPPSVYVVSWSSDGNFAVIGSRSDPSIQLLTASDGSALVLPADASAPAWNPKDAVLAYFTDEGQNLNVQNMQDLARWQIRLPGKFDAAIWNPGGDALALLSRDGSIWLALYPSLEGVAQLAPPASGVRDIQWSPDGDFLAYVSGQDILIIKTP